MTPYELTLALTLSLLFPSSIQAFGWNWLLGFATTTTSSSSTSSGSSSSSTGNNYQISIGNRNNTFANLTDYGTMISNVQINLARYNGSALALGTSDNLLGEAIYTVAEEYRNETKQSVINRLAWFDEQINQANEYAAQLQRNDISELVKTFQHNTQQIRHTANGTVLDCLNRSISVEDLIQSVTNQSEAGCLQARIQQMVAVRNAARANLREFLDQLHEVEDKLEVCVDLQDDFDEGMSDFYKIGCVSSILFDVQLETARANLTVEERTAEAGTVLQQVRAGLLECVSDVANYAFHASLALRHWINVCSVQV